MLDTNKTVSNLLQRLYFNNMLVAIGAVGVQTNTHFSIEMCILEEIHIHAHCNPCIHEGEERNMKEKGEFSC